MSEMEANKDGLTESAAPLAETVKDKKKREKAEAKEKKAQEKREAKMSGGSGKKKKGKKIAGIVAVVLVVFLVGYNIVASSIAKNAPTQISVIEASRSDVQQTLSTSGNVNSELKKAYYAPIGAKIIEMNISLGDNVVEGQQLVVFDTSDLELERQKAALDASSTANGYKSTQYQSNQNQSKYNEATIGLEELKVLRDQQEQYVKGLKYEMEDETSRQREGLEDWLNKLNKELEIQNRKLETQGNSDARGEIQDVIQNLNESVRETQNKLSALSSQDDMVARQRQIDAEQQKLDDMNEEINKREGKESSSEAGIIDPYAKQQQADNVQSRQLAVKEVDEKLQRAQEGIKAEFSGIVTKFATVSSSKDVASGGSVMEGATVTEGAELFTVESDKQVKVNIDITKYDLDKIAVGQQVDIDIAGFPYTGEVSKINKVAANNSQGTPVVGAEIHINNPDDNIYLGVEAKVVIHTAFAENVIAIPLEVVNADKEGDFCYVVEEGVVKMRRIVTGISSDMYVEIKEGLSEGDQIVYDVLGTVTEGMNVTAVPMNTGMSAGAAAETAQPETENQDAAQPQSAAETESQSAEETQEGTKEAQTETSGQESSAEDGTQTETASKAQ